MPLSELFNDLITNCPKTMSLLYATNHYQNEKIKNHIFHKLSNCTYADEFVNYCIDNDIAFACHHINQKFPDFKFTCIHLQRACHKNSTRILLFLFKYNNFEIINTWDTEIKPLNIFIETFIKNNLTKHLENTLLIYRRPKLTLITIIDVCENYLKNSEFYQNFYDSWLQFLCSFLKHYNLSINIVLDCCVNHVDAYNHLFPNVYKKLITHIKEN